MAQYEHIFLARQDLSQAQVDALAEAATKIVEDNKGKVVKTETWGLRTLTYKIQKNPKAHFVMLHIDGPGEVIAELEREMRDAAGKLEFERAAHLRDQLAKLKGDAEAKPKKKVNYRRK